MTIPRLFPRASRRPDRAASSSRAGSFARGFSAMRHRNYRIYWFGQIGSLVGAWMQSVALPWLVLDLGGSPLQLGTVLALMFAPSMFLAPIGGVLADRVDKRRVLMIVNAVAMLQAGLLFGLAATGLVEIWHVYLLALLAGFVNAVEMPIRQAFAAELVPPEDLTNAIALNSTSFNLSRVIGPAVAGVTIAVFGVALNFGINAVSYLSVLIGLWMLDGSTLRRIERPDRFPSIRSSLVEGVRYAIATPTVLWPLVLLGGMATFAMNFQTLLPLFTRDALDLDSGGYGALFAAMGAGSLVGSLMLAFTTSQRPMLAIILGGGGVFLLLELALGFVRSPLAAFPLVAGIGLASMLMVNTINVTIQNSVPDVLRGRVMSLYVMVFAGTAPIGGLLAGALAEGFGAPFAFSVGALLGFAVLALVGWQLRKVRMPRGAASRQVEPERPREIVRQAA
ncbi:MAG TPA: MFS transporter [Candidatus Limnocylindrales bacterium]|nr:MFS transporter [Candidatus Limnocylindrales bacterium]